MENNNNNEGLSSEMHYFICPQCRSQLFQPVRLLETIVDDSRAYRMLAEFAKNQKYPSIKENEVVSIQNSMLNHLRLKKDWEKKKTKTDEAKTKRKD